MKSRMATPSRRNSGFDTTESSGFSASSAPVNSSVVPGKTVLRIASIRGRLRPVRCWRISPSTRSSCSTERLPLRAEGVPTQMSAISELAKPDSTPYWRRDFPRRPFPGSPLPAPARRMALLPPGCWRSWPRLCLCHTRDGPASPGRPRSRNRRIPAPARRWTGFVPN